MMKTDMAKATRQAPDDYIQALNPQGYVNNREITNLPSHFLVKGSRDCVIVNKEKVVSRLGYGLVGDAQTKTKGHRSSFDWEKSSLGKTSLRLNEDGELEFYFVDGDGNKDWFLLKDLSVDGNVNPRANFASWWDSTELQDLLLFVTETDAVHAWSGGIAEVSELSTDTQLQLSGYYTNNTISFNEDPNGDWIGDSANNFVKAGFRAGDIIVVSGAASDGNNLTFTVESVTAGRLTLSDEDDLFVELSGATVVVKRVGATWGEMRFLTTGTRKVVVAGTEYEYSGGETTGILTGLTGLPAVTTGQVVHQAVITTTPAALDGMSLDLIAVQNNHVYYGDLTSRVVLMSHDDDYEVFTKTTPRAPGEGETFTLDSTPTAFVPGEDEMYISGRKNDWYKITEDISANEGSALMKVRKLKTASGQAAQSQAAVFNVKNAVAFLSFEPVVDTLTRLLAINTPQSVPLSHPIKDDLGAYDLTDAHGIYYQNQLFIALPVEGLVLIYDFEDQLWQPPHHLPVGRLALIDVEGDGVDVLCGHSSTSNETYHLYKPGTYNDNGAPIRIEMHFGYDNFGTRFTEKQFDELAAELYMSTNTIVTDKEVYDYKGATDIREFTIDGSDEAIRFAPNLSAGLGQNPHGSQPFGSLSSPIDDLSKFRVVNETPVLNFFERQRVFISESADARFAIIAYGENVEVSPNIPQFIKR